MINQPDPTTRPPLPVATVASIALTPDEIHTLTGYRQGAAQLAELHRQGFYRARRNALGQVVLERAHYDAVCRGQLGQAGGNQPVTDDTALIQHITQLARTR